MVSEWRPKKRLRSRHEVPKWGLLHGGPVLPGLRLECPATGLASCDIERFLSLFALQPGTIEASSFSGDINLAGDLVLSSSRTGNASIFAREMIQPMKFSVQLPQPLLGWGAADGDFVARAESQLV